jgi:hypothetical protein
MKMSPKQPKAPKDLSSATRRWWSLMQSDYDIEDSGGLAVLTLAARALDRAEAAKAVIDRDGMLVTDRWGQAKAHPACAVERDARAAMLAAIRNLHLDLEQNHSRPGRPGGSRY